MINHGVEGERASAMVVDEAEVIQVGLGYSVDRHRIHTWKEFVPQ